MDEKEKLVEFYYTRLQATRRAQKHYLALLLVLLGAVWVLHWGRREAPSPTAPAFTLSDRTLLAITPGVSTILLLGLIGSLGAVQPAWQLLKEAWKNAGGTTDLSLEGMDANQNWIDYLAFVWARPVDHLLQAAVFVAVLASTFSIGLLLGPKLKGYASFLFITYCLFCLAVQAAASWKWLAQRIEISRRKA